MSTFKSFRHAKKAISTLTKGYGLHERKGASIIGTERVWWYSFVSGNKEIVLAIGKLINGDYGLWLAGGGSAFRIP